MESGVLLVKLVQWGIYVCMRVDRMVSGRGFIKAVKSGPLDNKTIAVVFEDGPPVVVSCNYIHLI